MIGRGGLGEYERDTLGPGITPERIGLRRPVHIAQTRGITAGTVFGSVVIFEDGGNLFHRGIVG
jgi:hypothetical protein